MGTTLEGLAAAQRALITAGWTEAELEDPIAALQDLARKIQLQRRAVLSYSHPSDCVLLSHAPANALLRVQVAASYLATCNIAGIARALRVSESKIHSWRSVHRYVIIAAFSLALSSSPFAPRSMTVHALRWAQSPTAPFVASVRDFPISIAGSSALSTKRRTLHHSRATALATEVRNVVSSA